MPDQRDLPEPRKPTAQTEATHHHGAQPVGTHDEAGAEPGSARPGPGQDPRDAPLIPKQIEGPDAETDPRARAHRLVEQRGIELAPADRPTLNGGPVAVPRETGAEAATIRCLYPPAAERDGRQSGLQALRDTQPPQLPNGTRVQTVAARLVPREPRPFQDENVPAPPR